MTTPPPPPPRPRGTNPPPRLLSTGSMPFSSTRAFGVVDDDFDGFDDPLPNPPPLAAPPPPPPPPLRRREAASPPPPPGGGGGVGGEGGGGGRAASAAAAQQQRQSGRCTPLERDIERVGSHRSGRSRRRSGGGGLAAVREERDEREEESSIVETLAQKGFTRGLAKTLVRNADVFSLRIWVVDNSGSMMAPDGHRVVPSSSTSGKRVHCVECTRWEEVTSSVVLHASVGALTGAPIVFRLLNDPGSNVGPQQFSVAEDERSTPRERREELERVRDVLHKTRPSGSTPLTRHVKEIRDSIAASTSSTLVDDDRPVAVILATDGLPTDEEGEEGDDVNEEFVDALRDLASLPVWVVVRLSTDDRRVVEFYNAVDDALTSGGGGGSSNNVNIEVLDDFVNEAREVRAVNPWLNYGLPLHLCRENGSSHPVMDAIDERHLQPSEVRDFCRLLFEGSVDVDGGDDDEGPSSFPDPNVDWRGFVRALRRASQREGGQWNPATGKVSPWIDFRALDRIYGAGAGGGGGGRRGGGRRRRRRREGGKGGKGTPSPSPMMMMTTTTPSGEESFLRAGRGGGGGGGNGGGGEEKPTSSSSSCLPCVVS